MEKQTNIDFQILLDFSNEPVTNPDCT